MRKLLGLLLLLYSLPSWAALNFDGVDDRVDVSSVTQGPTASQQATFTAWVNITSTANYTPFLESRPSTNLLALLMSGAAGTPLTCSWNNTASEYNAATGLNIPLNQWVFCACTVNGTNMTVYRYSESTGFGSFQITLTATNRDMSKTWSMSRDSTNPNRLINGREDDVRLYSRALSIDEIRDLAFSRLRLPITDGLIGYWPMDDGVEGTPILIVKDRSQFQNDGVSQGSTNGVPKAAASDYISYP